MPHYYGKPLTAKVVNGKLTIEIGIHVLAHAAAYSDWANNWTDNPNDEHGGDYGRTFMIIDPKEFAKDVVHAMLDECEDGATPLSLFLDKAMEAAVNDGSQGTDEAQIKHGEFSPLETWARPLRPRR